MCLQRLALTQAAVVQRGGNTRVLFHVFSMAGWSMFGAMLRDMAVSSHEPRLSDICGAVVDSAPQIAVRSAPAGLAICTRTMAAAASAVLHGPKKHINERSASFRLLRTFFQVWVPRGGHRYRAIEAVIAAISGLATFPQLYAYSAADAVVRCTSIEGHIRDERRRGRVVRELRFGDSPHCGHFRRHRVDYTLAVQRFLHEDLQARPALISSREQHFSAHDGGESLLSARERTCIWLTKEVFGIPLDTKLVFTTNVELRLWFGCTEKNLEKYAAWWREQGWQPLLFRLERNVDALSERAGMRFAQASLKRLAAMQAAVVQRGGSTRVLFHAFSMAGWTLYGALLRDMAAARCSPCIADVCGVVLDSTPQIAISTRTMAAAACTVMGGPKTQPMESTASFRVLQAFFKVWCRRGGHRWRALEALIGSVLANEAFPQLYIYSVADLVIRRSSIEAHIQDERQRGRTVRSLRLADSPHCGHFVTHRAEYCAAIAEFVQEDLQVLPAQPAPAPPPNQDLNAVPADGGSAAELAGHVAADAEGPSTPRHTGADEGGAANTKLQPATPDIFEASVSRAVAAEQA
ncbi:hypothetical protein WJX81_007288 [Elliptochloris bilobata]|uniref:Uncharacterized protein n=1 Tax=Elliptochloris bilobata TaxID=381761 RepID=A0AAW1QZM2_9CHLO